ncbi:MAG: hypothetical protein Q7R52_01495 [archaeon]|nr:hypothetical protein [archaeon]
MTTRLLTRKERAYVIEKIGKIKCYTEEFGKLNKKAEDKLIHSIISKIQAPQEYGKSVKTPVF